MEHKYEGKDNANVIKNWKEDPGGVREENYPGYRDKMPMLDHIYDKLKETGAFGKIKHSFQVGDIVIELRGTGSTHPPS